MNDRKISVIGLGYVGLPLAAAFAEVGQVVAFDVNEARVASLQAGVDITGEVDKAQLQSKNLLLTSNSEDLRQADFHVIAVPTPIDDAKQPDLSPLMSASKTVGERLKSGDIVVYESTVYPGATEEVCVPVLEQASGLVCGKDFFVGYSPERINPGDKEHTFKTICKVVSGQTPEVLDIVAKVYERVVDAGVHRASSIKVAEAAKVIENTQRDLNIALINELAVIFNEVGINTKEVLAAAGTKWNFLNFQPGIVGGHCIGVDPYYLTHKATQVGYHPEVILAGRRINDNMGKYIAEQTIKQLICLHGRVRYEKVVILGLTFKENCPDIRNTKVVDIYRELESYGCDVQVHDPVADKHDVKARYGIELLEWDDVSDASVIILAVPHQFYIECSYDDFSARLSDPRLIIDIKSVVNKEAATSHGMTVWQL